MSSFTLLFAYFAPETFLPLTSIVATIAGVVMMLGRGSMRYVVHCVRRRHQQTNGARVARHPNRPIPDREPLPTIIRW